MDISSVFKTSSCAYRNDLQPGTVSLRCFMWRIGTSDFSVFHPRTVWQYGCARSCPSCLLLICLTATSNFHSWPSFSLSGSLCCCTPIRPSCKSIVDQMSPRLCFTGISKNASEWRFNFDLWSLMHNSRCSTVDSHHSALQQSPPANLLRLRQWRTRRKVGCAAGAGKRTISEWWNALGPHPHLCNETLQCCHSQICRRWNTYCHSKYNNPPPVNSTIFDSSHICKWEDCVRISGTP